MSQLISLANEVYMTIFSQLMALKIAPGARITVDNLARENWAFPRPPSVKPWAVLRVRGWCTRPT